MEIWQGTLRKMRAREGDPAQYALAPPTGGDEELALTPLLGRRLRIEYSGRIHCVLCGRNTRKSYGQGLCYPCFRDRPEADICIVKPELCHHGEEGNPCRDEEFAREHCFRPHVLYASLTSGCKVGITRRRNIPTRWLDQGAVAAIPLAELPDRRSVGLVEHRLASEFGDRTHWMTMLKTDTPPGDLPAFAEAILARLAEWGVDGTLPPAERTPRRFRYPILEHPSKVKSFNLDRAPLAEGVLQGIKGQYLIFDEGVINVRKFGGYEVSLSVE